MERESIEFDVIIVGAGPAGLSTSIKLMQLAQDHDIELSVCIVEKGSEVGAHILSGAVIDPISLTELLPNWNTLSAPIETAVTNDKFLFLTKDKAMRFPTPPQMNNKGNYIISLGQFCRWLAEVAQSLGVEIFPGFAAKEVLYDEHDRVYGIATGDMGIDRQGQRKQTFEPGIEIHGKQVVLAEGCRGSLTKSVEQHYQLRKGADPQTYGIGVKELWEIDHSNHEKGSVIHTVGWPLDNSTYGGSFIYHWGENLLSVGFVVGLDYQNPYLDPFCEMQRLKLHPEFKPLFNNAKRISYGARAINEGGLQSLPTVSFPGGLLVGDCAGFLNVPKIKGTHTAMKSGIEAANAIIDAFKQDSLNKPIDYLPQIKKTWLWKELHKARNIRPAFHKGLWPGLIYSAFDTYILRGNAPWTFKQTADHTQLKSAKDCKPIEYPAPDQKITFDKLSSVYLSNTNHEEDQPCHLQLGEPDIAITINYDVYASPEARYCPASVYEIVVNEQQQARLQINAQNCIHCKTCDIKDPKQNINWVPPEGGGGPNYTDM